MPTLQTVKACVEYAVNELALDEESASEVVASIAARHLGEDNFAQIVQQEIRNVVLGAE